MFDQLPSAVPTTVSDACTAVFDGLTTPGQTLTSEQRVAVAEIARTSAPRPLWEQTPDLFGFDHAGDTDAPLTAFVAALVERVTVESRSLDRDMVAAIVERIGDAMYAEIVAVIAQVVPIDHLHRALDLPLEPLPAPGPGQPSNSRPDGLGDIGAFIDMTDPFEGPNVARSLSLAGSDNSLRLKVVRSMYSGTNFGEMVWNDRPLSRPQIELVAARTSALNECFY